MKSATGTSGIIPFLVCDIIFLPRDGGVMLRYVLIVPKQTVLLSNSVIFFKEKEWKEDCKRQVMTAFARAEKRLKPNWKELFTDVYHEMPSHIQ